MSFLTPKMPAQTPPPPAPPEPDVGRAKAMAEEAQREEMGRRRGRGSTIVAGTLTTKSLPTICCLASLTL